MKRSKRIRLGILACALTVSAHAADGRKPIWRGGTVITEGGSYYLTRGLYATGTAPILDIQTSDVDIDLNGMSIGGNESAPGIRVGPFVGDITIRNGTISYVSEGISILSGSFNVVLEDLRINSPLG